MMGPRLHESSLPLLLIRGRSSCNLVPFFGPAYLDSAFALVFLLGLELASKGPLSFTERNVTLFGRPLNSFLLSLLRLLSLQKMENK